MDGMTHYARIAALVAAFKAGHNLIEYHDVGGKLWKVSWEPKA